MFNRKRMFNRKNSIQDMDAYVEERLSDFLDGTLPDQERTIVQAHLATSERARASLDALRYTVSLLKQTPAPVLPRQFTLPVTSRAPVQAAPGWLVWSLRGLGAAATAAFVILLVATLFRPGNTASTANLPAAAPAAPSGVIAMAPAATAPAPNTDVVSEAYDANATPIMLTEEPSTALQQVVPVTETPIDASRKSQPQQDADNVAPTIAPQPTSVPIQNAPATSAPPPTAAVAAGASANSSAAPELGQPTPTSELFTTRIAIMLEGQVTLSELIVRAGPGTEYAVIGGLRREDVVQIMGRSLDNGWLWVRYQKNRKTHEGWVSRAYVRVNGKLDTVPVTELGQSETPTVTPEPTETPLPPDQDATPDDSSITPTTEQVTPVVPATPDGAPTEFPGRSPTLPSTEGDTTATPTAETKSSEPAPTVPAE